MEIFTQIVILLIVLACMVMVLIAIRQLMHFEGFDDEEGTNHLKEEIDDDGHIISRNNIFSNLVETESEENTHKKTYNSKSKEPLSRRE